VEIGVDGLTLTVSEVCEVVEPWDDPGSVVVVGHSYLYDLDRIRREAATARLHLDAWLIRQVAARLYRERPKTPCLGPRGVLTRSWKAPVILPSATAP
jgi:hypothetical protein